MSINSVCSFCNHKFSPNNDLSGKIGECPVCQCPVRIIDSDDEKQHRGFKHILKGCMEQINTANSIFSAIDFSRDLQERMALTSGKIDGIEWSLVEAAWIINNNRIKRNNKLEKEKKELMDNSNILEEKIASKGLLIKEKMIKIKELVNDRANMREYKKSLNIFKYTKRKIIERENIPACDREISRLFIEVEKIKNGIMIILNEKERINDRLKQIKSEFGNICEEAIIANRYILDEYLGGGDFGRVWKAKDEKNITYQNEELYVAVKILPLQHSRNQNRFDNIVENYHKVYLLNHPYIAAYKDLVKDEDNETMVLVMEFVDGRTLDKYQNEYADRYEKITFSDVLRIASQIADGLDYAHREMIIHHDIKLDNIMIKKENDEVKILDFGEAEIQGYLAKNDQKSYNLPGVFQYPVQDPYQKETDQYALAILVYDLLSGQKFSPRDMPPGSLGPLEGLTDLQNRALLKALAKDPNERFKSCIQFITALGAGVESEEVRSWMSGRGIAIGTKNSRGLTLMHFAARDGRIDVLNWLKINGEEVDCVDNDGKTPLFYAATSGRTGVITWLKSEGCEINATAKDGSTPMHYAAARGFWEFMRVLKKLGAKVDIEDDNGQTPMFNAVITGRVNAMAFLKTEGVEINKPNTHGQTPILLAAYCNSVAAMRWLKEEGADLTIVDKNGQTITSIIEEHGNAEAKEWLAEQKMGECDE